MSHSVASPARRSIRTSLLLTCALLCSTPGFGWGQVIRGNVAEDQSEAIIVNAEVRLLDAAGEVRGTAISDSVGEFRIEVPGAGSFTLDARRLGYATVTSPAIEVEEGEEVEVAIRMSPEAVPLEPVVVVGRRDIAPPRIRDFYERAERARNSGWGTVFTREDLTRIRPVLVSYLLHRVPARPQCPYSIFLDGLPLADTGELDSFIAPNDVEGVEIYRGFAHVPPEFYRPGMCGLVLVWTRADTEGKPFTWTRVFIALGLGAVLYGLSQAF